MPALQPRERTPAYLTPCPGCGAENGITAMACWQCDRQLLPDPPPPSGGLWPPAPSDAASAAAMGRSDGATIAEETNPRMIERWGKTQVLATVPETKPQGATLPADVVAAVDLVDWQRFSANEP